MWKLWYILVKLKPQSNDIYKKYYIIIFNCKLWQFSVSIYGD